VSFNDEVPRSFEDSPPHWSEASPILQSPETSLLGDHGQLHLNHQDRDFEDNLDYDGTSQQPFGLARRLSGYSGGGYDNPTANPTNPNLVTDNQQLVQATSPQHIDSNQISVKIGNNKTF
jgi:hypothetical protein